MTRQDSRKVSTRQKSHEVPSTGINRRFVMRVALLTLIFVLVVSTLPATAAGAATFGDDSRIRASGVADLSTERDSPDALLQPSMDADPMLDEVSIGEVSATSLFAVDITTGMVLYQYEADTPVAPASTLKIVTALTALTVLDPDEEIPVSEEDLVDAEVYSNAALLSGDVVSVEDLLAGLLIPSGGDAANTLARAAGSQLGPAPGQSPRSRFVEEMNEVASGLGMRGSNFANPDGPDHPEQYTTARDMAIAGGALLQDRLLAEIVASTAWEMNVSGPNVRSYEVRNTNQLLAVDRVHGIKTGTTGEAGESIVLATRREWNQVLTVVMGSEDRYGDINALMEHIDSEVRWVHFGASDDFPGIQRAAERFNFVLAVPFVQPMLSGEADRLYANLWLGPRPRSTLPVRWGHVVFLHDGEELYRVPVLMAGDIGD